MKFKIRAARKKEAKRNNQNNWPITYRWVTMGAIVAYSAVGSKTMNVALAQSVPPPGRAISQAQSQRFDIAPGPLSDLLPQFARAAGITFTLSLDSIGTIQSPGVSGTFTIQEALQHLLEGTSVTFRFQGPTAVSFELRGRTESIVVSGRAPGADPYADPLAPYKADRLSSAKFTEPVLNTAKTETVLTQEALLEWAGKHVARFKLPKRFVIQKDPLPKGGTGKVLKYQLREHFWGDKEKRIQG